MLAGTSRVLSFTAVVLTAALNFSSASSQTIRIDPATTTGPTIKRAGWDIKQWPTRLNSDAEVRALYQDVDANFLRIPIFATAHSADGSVDATRYEREIAAIQAVTRGRPDVEIYASLKLQGGDTFPDWLGEATDDWPASTGRIFGNTVDRPNPEHYSQLIASYVKYMQDNGVRIDFIGLNNETENAVTVQRYIGTYDLLPAALSDAGVTSANSNFQFVGPDSFGLPTAESFVQGLNDRNRLDTIDFAASHYYPQHVSGNAIDWGDLQRRSNGLELWHTEVHMPGESRFIDVQSQSVRNSLSVLFASFNNGVDSIIWWEPPSTIRTGINNIREVMKSQVNDTVLGAAPVFTTPTFRGKGDPDGEPLYQAFFEDDQVTLWIVNPGDELTDLPVELLTGSIEANLTAVGYLAPDGDESWSPSETLTLGITPSAGGLGFTIDSVAAQSIAVVKFATVAGGAVLGDANGDGVVNNTDIGPFAMALFSPAMYLSMYPDSDPNVVLDMNNDGEFNNRDIMGFATALGF